ncbi:ADP-ribosylglycohydrolase [Streptomyces sp. AmelKG-D3]|nr:ADP-ribosylglycohydrolase [Streptomyces sp. AmelKG-D3]
MGDSPGPRLAPRPGDRVQRGGLALPGHRPLWALRTTDTFTSALAAAVDVGGDTDTVAAVPGGLAGAVYGVDAVPDRWTTLLHVPLPGYGDRVLRTPELLGLAARLDSEAPQNYA